MELGLLENAADSLRNGIGFYKRYIRVNNPYETGYSFLKSAVIFIHHASELILKRVLSDINELLIVSNIQGEDFLEFYKNILDNRNENERFTKTPIFYFLSGESDIKTIEYFNMIDKFGHICGLNKEEKNSLLY